MSLFKMNDEAGSKKHVWILGLNHAGTTIVWKAWRRDGRFLCFDEPTTANIGAWFPENNDKGTFDEYLGIFRTDLRRFWDLYAPISPLQELDREFTAEQERYLRFLIAQGEQVVVDETHLHYHIAALAQLFPEAYVIHLYRRASAFATSHLRPTWSWDASWARCTMRWARHVYNKRNFWGRRDFIPGMCRNEVIGNHPMSKFGLALSEAGCDAQGIMAAPVLVRLLAYWHFHYHYLEREGPRVFGSRFRSLRYEEFASDPERTMRDLYQWIGMSPPHAVTYREVHPPKPPFRERDLRWRTAAAAAGFADDEIETLL